MSDIHTRIKELRTRAGMSMEGLAKAVGISSWQTVQQWENGKTAPNRNRIGKVAAALNTTPEYLLTGTVPSAVSAGAIQQTKSCSIGTTHPHPQIQRIIRMLEQMTDVGIGEVLAATRAAAAEHPKAKKQTGS